MEKEKIPPQIPLVPFSIQHGLSPPISLSRTQTTDALVAPPSVPTGSLAVGPLWGLRSLVPLLRHGHEAARRNAHPTFLFLTLLTVTGV